jgi:hypothetical protein
LKFRITLAALIIGVFALPSASLAEEINYDDPNMARTNHFVSEATSACLRYHANPENFEKCVSAYAVENHHRESVVVAQVPPKAASKKAAKSSKPAKSGAARGETSFASESPEPPTR